MNRNNDVDNFNKPIDIVIKKSMITILENILKISLGDIELFKMVVQEIIINQNNNQNGQVANKQDLRVPGFIIATLNEENMFKVKLYDANEAIKDGPEKLSVGEWGNIFRQAIELGVPIVFLAGVDLLREKEIIKECTKYPEVIFPIITKALAINEEWIEFFHENRNIIPIIPIEGNEQVIYNISIGLGVNRFNMILDLLSLKKLSYAISLILNRENFELFLSADYIKEYYDKGCRNFIFNNFKTTRFSRKLGLTKVQINEIEKRLNTLRHEFNGIFIHMPDKEEAFVESIYEGNGFIHINPDGGIDRYPFVKYPVISLKDTTLENALKDLQS